MEILGAIGAQCTARNPPTSRVATVHFEPTPGKDAFPEAVAAAPGNLHLPQAQLKKRKAAKVLDGPEHELCSQSSPRSLCLSKQGAMSLFPFL